MHYYIDGYNLLFKEAWARTASSLEEARKQLIMELDQLAAMLHIDVTVVFDAPFQSDDLKRGHYRSLEIIFTAKGQSADDYLVACVDAVGKKAVVVTSDRGLRARIKGTGASVEGVHDFLVHLRKKSRNKLAKSKSKPLVIKKQEVAQPLKEELSPQKPLDIDMKNLPSFADIPAWEKIFTSRLKNKGT